MALSNVTAEEMLNHITGQAASTTPTQLWLTAFNKTISEDLGGGETLLSATPPYTGHELTSANGGFTRFAVDSSGLNVSDGYKATATAGHYTNNGIWLIGTATAAGGGYGTIASMGLVDANDGNGQIRVVADITDSGGTPTPMTVTEGEILQFPDGSYQFDAGLVNNPAGPSMELSTYSNDRLMQHVLGLQTWSIVGRFEALFTGATAGTELPQNNIASEVPTAGGTNYARVTAPSFGAAVARATASTSQVSFPQAGSAYPSPVTFHALMETVSTATVILWTASTNDRTIGADVTPRYDAGTISYAMP